jgi:hypothetical protein
MRRHFQEGYKVCGFPERGSLCKTKGQRSIFLAHFFPPNEVSLDYILPLLLKLMIANYISIYNILTRRSKTFYTRLFQEKKWYFRNKLNVISPHF